MPDALPPTPMPGAKPSAPDRGDPRAATDKATHAEQSAANQPSPAERVNTIAEHATALQKVFGKAQAPTGTTTGGTPSTVEAELDKALAGVKANPDPEYN